MGYILNTEAMRVVTRNERGNVDYRKRYRKGDEVDTSKMDEAHVQNLIERGTLVQSEDDLTEQESATGTSPVSGPYGASTEVTPETEAAAASTPEAQPDSNAVEDVDEYSDMDYASLQREAKERDLSAGGSADDLRARLRADDADSEA